MSPRILGFGAAVLCFVSGSAVANGSFVLFASAGFFGGYLFDAAIRAARDPSE